MKKAILLALMLSTTVVFGQTNLEKKQEMLFKEKKVCSKTKTRAVCAYHHNLGSGDEIYLSLISGGVWTITIYKKTKNGIKKLSRKAGKKNVREVFAKAYAWVHN